MNPEYERILQRSSRNHLKYTGFLKQLKGVRKLPLDTLFRDAHDAAFDIVDCRECGRCCAALGPRIRHEDISRLAGRERINPRVFIDTYLKKDEDGDLVFKSMPCPFFGGNGDCRVYEDRPRSCRDYPHMNQGRQANMISMHIENLRYCPGVVLAVERLIAARPL